MLSPEANARYTSSTRYDNNSAVMHAQKLAGRQRSQRMRPKQKINEL